MLVRELMKPLLFTGVDTGKFHVFHHGRDVNVFTVGEGVGFAFESVVEEAVDEERTIRSHAPQAHYP